MKKLKDNIKKIVIGGIAVVLLTAPVFRMNYYSEGEGLEVRKYSIITSLAEDIKEGSLLTHKMIYWNIQDRSQELYNDIVYGMLK